MKLSLIQEKIVATKGNLIVKASAGTGKTHTMVNKIVNEIKNNKSHKVVAAITFTIKAAQEIKSRITIDVSRHFIGTNNSFAIEEIIKPFMKDVYGLKFDLDMSTDYSLKIESFEEGLGKILMDKTLCSYDNKIKKNFIFELAYNIVEKSTACQLYLKSRYFKIYIDEYQDCDQEMHKFFMYLCNCLNIETFVVGDAKQSIYMWRGAYPEAFKSIWDNESFEKIFMGDNFRSCIQIQNYSNLLCSETRHLYNATPKSDNVILIENSNSTWPTDVLQHIDRSLKLALLRFSKDNASIGANMLSQQGLDCVYIPQIPIAEITTEAAWLYSAIAKYNILENYSVYDVVSEIPSGINESIKKISIMKAYLDNISNNLDNIEDFKIHVVVLAKYLGYSANFKHIESLHKTICDTSYHIAFEPEKYNNVAITFHSSKGLEFDQVIVFAEDYNLINMASIYNHYVAVTRAKCKLIIIKSDCYNAELFEQNINRLFNLANVSLDDIVKKY